MAQEPVNPFEVNHRNLNSRRRSLWAGCRTTITPQGEGVGEAGGYLS
jgi:hypothetical protein